MKIRRIPKYYLLRLKRLKGTPRSLAKSCAIGAGLGITPTLPFHTVMILTASFVFRLNPFAGILAATIVSNPLTFVPHYYAAWWLGSLLFPDRLDWNQIETLLYQLRHEGFWHSTQLLYEVGYSTLLIMSVGGALLGLITGVFTFMLSLRFFNAIERKKREKRLLNNKKKV
ncbi:MAG: hypothetical protein CSA32_03495 [Desulfobulbus propionicus]|nr:MAG: hypothetical protein CSA32_03495 [Desulfobulbus propionicus]